MQLLSSKSAFPKVFALEHELNGWLIVFLEKEFIGQMSWGNTGFNKVPQVTFIAKHLRASNCTGNSPRSYRTQVWAPRSREASSGTVQEAMTLPGGNYIRATVSLRLSPKYPIQRINEEMLFTQHWDFLKVYPLGHTTVSWQFLYNLIRAIQCKGAWAWDPQSQPVWPIEKEYGTSHANIGKSKFCLKEFLGWSWRESQY